MWKLCDNVKGDSCSDEPTEKLSPKSAAPLGFIGVCRTFQRIVYLSGAQLYCFSSLS